MTTDFRLLVQLARSAVCAPGYQSAARVLRRRIARSSKRSAGQPVATQNFQDGMTGLRGRDCFETDLLPKQMVTCLRFRHFDPAWQQRMASPCSGLYGALGRSPTTAFPPPPSPPGSFQMESVINSPHSICTIAERAHPSAPLRSKSRDADRGRRLANPLLPCASPAPRSFGAIVQRQTPHALRRSVCIPRWLPISRA